MMPGELIDTLYNYKIQVASSVNLCKIYTYGDVSKTVPSSGIGVHACLNQTC